MQSFRHNGSKSINSTFRSGIKIIKNEFLTNIHDDDYVDYTQSSDVYELISKPIELNSVHRISSCSRHSGKISFRALCDENSALVEPLVLYVDKLHWFAPKYRTAARFQSLQKTKYTVIHLEKRT